MGASPENRDLGPAAREVQHALAIRRASSDHAMIAALRDPPPDAIVRGPGTGCARVTMARARPGEVLSSGGPARRAAGHRKAALADAPRADRPGRDADAAGAS